MSEDKKVNITETDEALEITINWFSPVAYFLAFFSLFWCGFLVVWFSVAIQPGAPLMMRLFPLIHVAVGIGLAYYTLCLFFNKTYMDVYKNYLTVYHKPIPWWRGNKEIPTQDIKQLYVNEKITKTKNGVERTYELMARMVDNRDKTLLSLRGITSGQAKALEKRLEAYIGIENQPVAEEYYQKRNWWGEKNNAQPKAIEPRRHRRDFMTAEFAKVYHLKERDTLNYKNSKYKIGSIAQYDWVDGNSDKQFQMIDDQNKGSLLYLIQNKVLLEIYEEKALPFFEMTDIKFYRDPPLKLITHKEVTYTLNTFKTGKQFINLSDKEHITVEQWVYHSADSKEYLRIIDKEKTLTIFEGTQQDVSDFEDKLDLSSIPEKEIELRDSDNDWDKEELV